MSLTHTATFHVRHYELDPYGHVNNVMYLRYMQEAAFAASAAVGYPLTRYTAMQRLWVIHETQIEYLRPLTYGDVVEVKTWVADFGKMRSRRMYEIRRAGDEVLAAKGYSDWVFMDTATERPAAIPPELSAAFCPEGQPPVIKRQPFPTPPPAPTGAFRLRRAVEWRDVDAVQHVNNATYLVYTGECSFAVGTAFGWPHTRAWQAGFAFLTLGHHVEYRTSAVYGDELELTTWLSKVGAASAMRHFEITRVRDGKLVARVNTEYVCVDRTTLKPIRIPADFRADLASNVARSPHLLF